MIKIELDENPDKEWNDRLQTTDYGTIYQAKEYALFKKLKGEIPAFLKFIDQKGDIIGQLLLLFNSKSNSKPTLGKIIRKAIGKSNLSCKWTYGPIIFDKNYSKQIGLELSNFLISKKCNIKGSEHPYEEESFYGLDDRFRIKKWATFILDLKVGSDALWKKFDKHSAKKNIERSEQRGILVKQMDKSDYLIFRKMSQDIGKGSQIELKAIEEQWDALQPSGYTGFLAFEEDEPIGGIMVGHFNGYLNEFNIVRTRRDYFKKFYSQDLLKWKIIEWAIGKNYNYYDLSGVNPEPQNEKEEGIFRYKKKWGGELVNYKMISSN